MNSGALAYIGDSVYEVYIRKHTMGKGNIYGDVLHRRSVAYVNATAQCMVIKKIIGDLSEEDQTLVKRGRNKKTTTKPKNVDLTTYKWATGFEALLGYYFLSEQYDKLDGIIERAIAIIEEEQLGKEKSSKK